VDAKKFKTFTLEVAEKNLGVWASKLKIFSKTFELGSDFTLLLEDDVLLKPDALDFCSEAYNFISNADELITVSLYSSNLVELKNVSYSKAIQFVSENPNVFHEWGLRTWPFPWGIGLSKKAYDSFMTLGWNGNDQNMGQLLQRVNGYDLFPIISRSDHIGKSKSVNGEFEVVRHINFEDSNYLNRKFQITSQQTLQLEQGINRAGHFFSNLKNDLGLLENRVKILYGDPIFLEKIGELKDNNDVLDIDASFVDPLWFSDIDSIKLYNVITRIAAPVTVLLFNDSEIRDYIISRLKNQPTKVLIGLDNENIFVALKNLI
jgi:GR25 family glycosyltransferase involved in LPS biosynthesis